MKTYHLTKFKDAPCMTYFEAYFDPTGAPLWWRERLGAIGEGRCVCLDIWALERPDGSIEDLV